MLLCIKRSPHLRIIKLLYDTGVPFPGKVRVRQWEELRALLCSKVQAASTLHLLLSYPPTSPLVGTSSGPGGLPGGVTQTFTLRSLNLGPLGLLSGHGCCTCLYTINTERGRTRKILNRSPGCQTSAPLANSSSISSWWSQPITPAKMVTLFLACWSLGLRTTKRLGGRYSWGLNGILTASPGGSIGPYSDQHLGVWSWERETRILQQRYLKMKSKDIWFYLLLL